MKNLLSTLATLAIIASTPVILINTAQKFEHNETFLQDFYWNNDHSNKEWSISVGAGKENSSSNWFDFNLAKSKNFTSISLLNSKGFSFSWNNDRYGPWWFGSKSINLDANNNIKITGDNFNKYLQFEVYDETVNDFFAKMHSMVQVGYAWYQENGDYHFQFLVYQFIHSINSVTGGANFANLGTALRLS